MIKIKRIVCNMLQENCYIVSDSTAECVIIDCGAYYKEERDVIVEYITENKLKPAHLIATHGHLDHNFGNATMREQYGLKVEIAPADVPLLQHAERQAAGFYGMKLDFEMPEHGHELSENEVITFGDSELKVMFTPGHSRGSVVLYSADSATLFTGDTLFRGSIGRTDLSGGNMMQIIQSLRKLAQLPDETVVWPGHGPQTTIGEELVHNPYMER